MMRRTRRICIFRCVIISVALVMTKWILDAMESPNSRDHDGSMDHDTEDLDKDALENDIDSLKSPKVEDLKALKSPMDEDQKPLYSNRLLDCNFLDTHFGRTSLSDIPDTSSKTFVFFLRCILINKVRHELEGFPDATLLDIPMHSNKGDSAIVIGELSVLAALNVTLVHYSNFGGSDNVNVRSMNTKKMVVLGHGGGNVGTWPEVDKWRDPELQKYRNFKYVLLAQSAHIYDAKHLRYMQNIYSRHPDATFLLRDLDSYRLCQQHFPSVHSVLVPDMAFGIGPIGRFAPPTMDVIWINRDDKEKNENHKPKFPDGVSYLVSDWRLGWDTPKGQNSIDNSYLPTFNGFLFLQRGRVVVTDRLHGLIMSVLLGHPVVIVDNKIHKLTNYFDTWLRGVDNVLIATSTEDAVNKAIFLLERVKTPEISPGNKNIRRGRGGG